MQVRLRVPATTANLGPGFDALGLALDLWNEAVFDANEAVDDDSIQVTVEGEGKAVLPADGENAIVRAAVRVFDLAARPVRGFQLRCINRVPLGSGLGSSSAALLAGMLGANAMLGGPFGAEQILKLAIESEGHPDNVAPAMLGGLVASIVHEDEVFSIKLPARANHGSIHATVVLPDFEFPTEKARAILPTRVERSAAVYNMSRAVIVTEALRTGNLELLGRAMTDQLHQPYRIPLIPGAEQAIDAGRRAGAAAVALSGAGPSLIAFTAKTDPAIGAAMRDQFQAAGLTARVFELAPTSDGAQVSVNL